MADSPEADVAIVGGGPVGCALALALAESAVSVALVAGGPPAADRPIALSYGSRLVLERLGAWQGLEATPIETIHVSQRGGFGRAVMRNSDHGLPALGYVAAYSRLSGALTRIPVCADALVTSKTESGGVDLRLRRGAKEIGLRARLLVLAHGGVLERAAERDYRQHAVVAEVSASRPHAGTAWERFTAEGPLALLPFRDRYAMVWSTRPESAESLMALPEADFLARLRETFGGRAGEFLSIGARAVFPLALRRGRIDPAPHTLAVGNAAQALHPVAGQGLNLGLRDAWELSRLLLDVSSEEIGSPDFISRYARRRRLDRRGGIGFTDFLARAFTSGFAPVAAARGAGLAALDILPPARRFLARRMMFGARALP